jgi:hypothetical protein
MLGLFVADTIRRLAERAGIVPDLITRSWTKIPYLTRWTVLGQRFAGKYRVFLHHFQDSDFDAMHSHPWPFCSLILSGGYYETTPAVGWNPETATGPTHTQWFGPGRFLVRPKHWIHKVTLKPGVDAWTLVFTGKKFQSWGFFCPGKGLVPWRVHMANYDHFGGGCGGPD